MPCLRPSVLSCLLIVWHRANAFQLPPLSTTRTTFQTRASLLTLDPQDDPTQLLDLEDDEKSSSSLDSRRDFLGSASSRAATLSAALFLATTPRVVRAEQQQQQSKKPSKVLVLGGTGFVGAQVVQQLREAGVETVVATSRDGRDGTVALDVRDAARVKQVVQDFAKKNGNDDGATAIISCVGAIGTADDEAVNSGTATAAQAAATEGVSRFVYITVAPEVAEFAKGIEFLEGYMKGKALSRQTVLDSFGTERSTLIEPTFIYGGGSFELNPPRVASFYGKFIEGLLSSSLVRNVERALSPGIIKIALEAPVPVEDVAKSAVAGAFGMGLPVLDSYDKIKTAAATLD